MKIIFLLILSGHLTLANDFPCSLDVEHLPEIILMGETHNLPSHLQIKQHHLNMANQEKFLMGLEGPFFTTNALDPSNDFGLRVEPDSVWGIESDITYTGSILLSLMVAGYNSIYNPTLNRRYFLNYQQVLDGFFTLYHSGSIVQNLIRRVDLEDTKNIQVQTLLSNLKQALNETERDKFYQTIFFNDLLWDNAQIVLELSTLIYREFLRVAEENNVAWQAPDLELADRLSYELENYRIFELVFKMIVLDWRNKLLAQNIAQLYCISLERGKNLLITVGSLHLDPLAEILSQRSDHKILIERVNLNQEHKVYDGATLTHRD